MFKFWFRKLMRKVMKKINFHNQSATFNSLRYPKKTHKSPFDPMLHDPKTLVAGDKNCQAKQ